MTDAINTRRFKTELHCHTRTVSPCAADDPRHLVEAYVAAGYDSVVITDHLTTYAVNHPAKIAFDPEKPHFLPSDFDYTVFEKPAEELSWQDKMEFYTAGARYVREIAGDRLHVIQGAEFNLPSTGNDYLLFGADRAFLDAYPDLDQVDVPRLRDITREAGVLLVQAHPFRNYLMTTPPKYLDGMEIYNGNPDQDARNFLAKEWAARYGLLPTAGTDYHNPDHTPNAGILTSEPVTTARELVRVLRSREYGLVRNLIPHYEV